MPQVRELLTFRFKPNRDLWAVLLSFAAVTASLYVATFVVGAKNGVAYFLVYGLLTAAVCGIAFPLFWTVVIAKRPVSSLGLTTKLLGVSLVVQLVLAAGQYLLTLARVDLPAWAELMPLIALVLCIGFFEAVFWRGWVFSRLEEMFGFLPALALGAALYAVYHIGYGMTWSEMAFLFWIGVFYASVFRLTRNVFILWPLLQPLGQLFTLSREGLGIPAIATLGFAEVLIVMFVLVFLANRYQNRRAARTSASALPATADAGHT